MTTRSPAINHPSYAPTTEPTAAAVARMIDESILTDRIVHEDYSEALAEELLVECDGNVDTDDAHEFWGVRSEGTDEGDIESTWRIHLDR